MWQRASRSSAFLVLWLAISACADYSSAADDQLAMHVNLNNTSHEEFVDFLYGFASTNRLNVQWFGWHSSIEPVTWFERSDRPSMFKVGLYMLSEENGHLYVSNRFDEKHKINLYIDYGDGKAVWLKTVKNFKRALASRGWRLEELNLNP